MAVQFGHTWWGRAWVDALEQRARVDPNRLARGRTYARQDRVTSLAVERGRVLASVRGSRRLDYRTRIDVRTYGDDEWARVVDAIAGRAGHTAACPGARIARRCHTAQPVCQQPVGRRRRTFGHRPAAAGQ